MRYVPADYARRAIGDLIDDPEHALFMDPGLGKTAITLSAIVELKSLFEINRALVIAPLRVTYTTWPAEVAKWDQFRRLKTHNLHEHGLTDAKADLYLINPEGVPALFGKPMLQCKPCSGFVFKTSLPACPRCETPVVLRVGDKEKANPLLKRVWQPGYWAGWKNRPEMLIVDESTKFKSEGVRSKTLRRYTADFARRVALTGTPAPNGVPDLFGQMMIVDRGATLGPNVTQFRKRFMTAVPTRVAGGRAVDKYVARDGAFDEISEILKPRVTALEAADWLKMPDKIVTNVSVVLDARTAETYRKAVTEAFAVLHTGESLFAQGGAAVKLKQIANGQVYVTDPLKPGRTVTKLHEAKAEALDDLLEQINAPTLVAYEYDCDGEMLAGRLKAPRIKGGMKMTETTRLFERWNKGELPVLLVQPQAAAHGLNLQAGGHHIVWYSLPWDLETVIQFNARLWRQGQASHSVFVYHIVAEDTVDRRVAAVLSDKFADQAALISALKSEIEEGRIAA